MCYGNLRNKVTTKPKKKKTSNQTIYKAQLKYVSPLNCPNSESSNYYENDQKRRSSTI